MSIYEDVKTTGGYISNHYSDLYIEVNDTNQAILQKYPQHKPTVFMNAVTNKLCYDVPFAFDPYWKERSSCK